MKVYAYAYPETAQELVIEPASRDCPVCTHVLSTHEPPVHGGAAVGFLVVDDEGETEIRRVQEWCDDAGLHVACELVDEAEVIRELNERHVLFVEGARL